jgi:low affinity Fe/Cu permease
MRYNLFYELNGKKHHKVITIEKKETQKIKKDIAKLGGINIKLKPLTNGTEGNL